MRGPWKKMFAESSEMDSAGVTLWSAIIFGGLSSLVALYLMDTQTQLPGFLKGAASISVGVTVGGFAASSKFFRRFSAVVCTGLWVLWIIRLIANLNAIQA